MARWIEDTLTQRIAACRACGERIIVAPSGHRIGEVAARLARSRNALVILEHTSGVPDASSHARLDALLRHASPDQEVWWVLCGLERRAELAHPPSALHPRLQIIMEVRDAVPDELSAWRRAAQEAQGVHTNSAPLNAQRRGERAEVWAQLGPLAQELCVGISVLDRTTHAETLKTTLADAFELDDWEVLALLQRLVEREVLRPTEDGGWRFADAHWTRIARAHPTATQTRQLVLRTFVAYMEEITRRHWRGEHAAFREHISRNRALLEQLHHTPSLPAPQRAWITLILCDDMLLSGRWILPPPEMLGNIRQAIERLHALGEQDAHEQAAQETAPQHGREDAHALCHILRGLELLSEALRSKHPSTELLDWLTTPPDEDAASRLPCQVYQVFVHNALGVVLGLPLHMHHAIALGGRLLRSGHWPFFHRTHHLSCGFVAMAQRHEKRAASHLRNALREAARAGDVLFAALVNLVMARLAYLQGDLQRATDHCRAYHKAQHHDPWIDTTLGSSMKMIIPLLELEHERTDAAIRETTALLSRNEEQDHVVNVMARACLVLAAVQQGDMARARGELEQLRTHHPTTPQNSWEALLPIVECVVHRQGTLPSSRHAHPWVQVIHRIAQQLLKSQGGNPSLLYHPGGDWFILPDGTRVDLGRRTHIKRAFVLLANAEGAVCTCEALIEHVWHGEMISHDAAMQRLRVLIYQLRREGLRDILLTTSGGYHLSPEITCQRRAEPTT